MLRWVKRVSVGISHTWGLSLRPHKDNLPLAGANECGVLSTPYGPAARVLSAGLVSPSLACGANCEDMESVRVCAGWLRHAGALAPVRPPGHLLCLR